MAVCRWTANLALVMSQRMLASAQSTHRVASRRVEGSCGMFLENLQPGGCGYCQDFLSRRKCLVQNLNVVSDGNTFDVPARWRS